MTESNWRKVGVVGVDAGMVWIGDPCYCVTPDAHSHPAQTWREFCSILDKKAGYNLVPDTDVPPTKEQLRASRKKANAQQWNYKAGHTGLGVTVSSGYGDGTYDVFVRENVNGVVAEAKIVFMDQTESEEDEEG